MTSGWKEYKIEDLNMQIIDGDRGKNYPHKEELLDNGYCLFLSAQNVTKNGFDFKECQWITKKKDEILRNGKLEYGDIVITTRGTVGNVALYSNNIKHRNMRINSGMLIVRCNDNICNKFIYYILSSKVFAQKILSMQTGTAQPQLPKSHFQKMKIILPPLETQQKIAKVLSVIDNKIELNNKINENLEQQAQAIFKSWFVDFEPFGGTMPEDWEIGTFSDIINYTISGDWGKDKLVGNNTEMVYCVRGADIPEVRIGNKGKMPFRYILPKNYIAKKLTNGDLVVEISGGSPTQSTGRIAAITKHLLQRYDKDMICTNFCKAIKPKENYSMFIYHYWLYLYKKNVFFSYENGTTGIKNLDINGFIETEPIIIPDMENLLKFSELCQNIESEIFANGCENEKLTQLRDALLPKLMNGEIDVENVKV